ncbi:MAG: DUF4209 domain-containing protein [Ignavibacteria bacterium]
MNKLEEYILLLDNSNLDDTNHLEIENNFQKIRDDFVNSGDNDNADLAQLEMEVYSFTKNYENNKIKLSFRFSGKRKDTDGKDIPFEWPNSDSYDEDKYSYIHKRFISTNNSYCKKEYGLFLLLAKNSKYKNNDIAKEVLNALFNLSSIYIGYIQSDINDDKHYTIFLINSVNIMFILSKSRANNEKEINEIYCKVKDFIFNMLSNWDINHKMSLAPVGRISELIINNIDDFKYYDINLILEKIFLCVVEISKYYLYGGIDLAKIGLRFEKKVLKGNNPRWIRLIAEYYEKLARLAEEKKDSTAVVFYEESLKNYKLLNDQVKINEIEGKFVELKNMGFGFGIIKTEIPQDETNQTYEKILKLVKDAGDTDIISFLISTPMFMNLDQLNVLTEEQYQKPSLLNQIGKNVIDKRGYTVEVFETEEDKKEYLKLELFGINFQLSTADLWWFFIESIREHKLNHDLIYNYLETTWIGKTYKKMYNGKYYDIKPLEIVNPGLILIFDEFEKAISDYEHKPNLVCAIDSLTLKIEYLLRYFCEELGIATYKDKNMELNLKEEKNIYDFLSDEKLKTSILQDDIFFIKYVLLSKMGKNLRHNVAHGLMDFHDYDSYYAILLICIIMKLSSYQFVVKLN